MLVGCKVLVDPGAAEHVEGNQKLRDESLDLGHWEGGVTGGEGRDIMALEGLDGTFGIIGTVVVGRD